MDGKIRATKARSVILDIILASPKPVTAQDIISQLTNNNISINKTTVYRDLQYFTANGQITEVIISAEHRYYESAKKSHHHHLICNKCRTIAEITLVNDLDLEEKRLELTKGFKIVRHTAEFFGLCNNCQ